MTNLGHFLCIFLLSSTSLIESKPAEIAGSCSSCEKLVRFSRKLSDILKVNEVRVNVANWCVQSNLGDNHKMCEFVFNNTESVLSRVDSNRFCNGIEACHSHHPSPLIAYNVDNSSTECEFCLNTMTHIKEIVSSTATANEIKSLLSTGCESLKELKSECVRLIDEEMDTIFQFIRNQFDPKKLCIETHSCPTRESNRKLVHKKLPEVTDFINLMPQTLATPVVLSKGPIAVSSTPQCLICHFLFKLIDKELKKNSTVEAIEKVLDKACSTIFKDDKEAACEEQVDKYAKQIIDLAAQGATAEVACLIFGACDLGETSGKTIKKSIPKVKSFECELCKKLFEYLYDFLGGDKAQEAIEKALDKVCDKMFSGDQAATCESYINTYTPVITDIVIQTTNPDDACNLLNLCAASVKKGDSHIIPMISLSSKAIVKTSSNSDCDTCKVEIQANLDQIKSIRKSYGAMLDSTCQSLEPSSGLCESYQKTINATFDILEKNADPETACSFFQVCSLSSNRIGKGMFTGEREIIIAESANKKTVNKDVAGVKFSVCTQCQEIARYIEEQISDYQTEEEISEFIKNDVCGRLPNAVLKETCQSFMVEYGDSFIYKIALKIFDPELVCSKELRVCPSSSKEVMQKSSSISSDIEIINDAVGSTCNLCVDVVSKIESILSTSKLNATNNEIVNHVCQFESKDKTEKCKIMFDAFGAHFVQMIGFDSPQKICSVVDICYNNNNAHLLGGQKCTFGPAYWCHTSDHANACKATHFCKKNVWKAVEQNVVQDTPKCVLCHLLLNVVDKELENNSTVEEIESVLNSACSKIYKDQTKLEECQDRVQKYTKRFIDLATQGVSPEVACIIFGFCEAGENSKGVSCLRDEKVSCPLCKQVVKKVYDVLSANKTREEIDNALENACNLMPETQKQACLVYIKVYDEKLAELIAESADAEEVCRKIGLCSEQVEEIAVSETEYNSAPDPECIMCKKVFEYLYSYLQENRTEQAIESTLEKVCDVFPRTEKKVCRKFVDTYTSQIINLVLQTTDPKEACTLLNMCKQSSTYNTGAGEVEEIIEIVPLTQIGPKAVPSPLGDDVADCVNCYTNTAFISQLFENSVKSLSGTLTNACVSYLKDESKCKNYMATYFDQALAALTAETDIEYICKNVLQVCDPDSEKENSIVTNSIEKKRIQNDAIEVEGKPRILCAECEAFAKYIQSQIYDYKTEEEISKFIKNGVCEHFPTHGMKDSCVSFMNEYGDSVIQMIALKIFDPQTLCSKELKLCSSSVSKNSGSKSSEFDFIDSKVEETCKLCVDMVKKMEAQPNEKVCSQYKSSESQKCQSIYDAFGKHFSTMIAFDSAEKICGAVDLCFNITNSHLLGGQKCTFGPSYWCNTKAHAEACSALDFCQKKVWLPIE